MDDLDRRIVNGLQGGFPVCERPFAAAAARLGCGEEELMRRIGRLLQQGLLTRFGPLYDVERMGGAFTLAAMSVPAERFDRVAQQVNAFPEVAHNYRRDHAFNMWFVLAADAPEKICATLARIEAATGLPVLDLPREAEYFLEFKLSV